MRSTRALAPVFACVLACASDSGGIDSGLPTSKPADQLAKSEQDQLCEAAEAYYRSRISEDEYKRIYCVSVAISVALAIDQSIATCAQSRDECLAMPLDPDVASEYDTATCDLGIDWTTCSATVREIEACFGEYFDASADLFTSYSCDRMAEYVNDPPEAAAVETGPACQTAHAKCPSIELDDNPD
jgi:hypothetical protein